MLVNFTLVTIVEINSIHSNNNNIQIIPNNNNSNVIKEINNNQCIINNNRDININLLLVWPIPMSGHRAFNNNNKLTQVLLHYHLLLSLLQ